MNKSLTKNLLAKLSLFLLLLVFAHSCTSGGTKKKKEPGSIETEPSTSDKDMGPRMKPILLIIGEDLSGSYEGFVKFKEENLKNLCEKITQSGRGGAVAVDDKAKVFRNVQDLHQHLWTHFHRRVGRQVAAGHHRAGQRQRRGWNHPGQHRRPHHLHLFGGHRRSPGGPVDQRPGCDGHRRDRLHRVRHRHHHLRAGIG